MQQSASSLPRAIGVAKAQPTTTAATGNNSTFAHVLETMVFY